MPPKKNKAKNEQPIEQQNEQAAGDVSIDSDASTDTSTDASGETGSPSDADANSPATKSVRWLISISGHDFNAAPGDVTELPADLADAFADGERAVLADE